MSTHIFFKGGGLNSTILSVNKLLKSNMTIIVQTIKKKKKKQEKKNLQCNNHKFLLTIVSGYTSYDIMAIP